MDKPVREPAPARLTPKSIAGRFKIVRELGRGGAGIVYEGVQLSVDRRVAVKVLHSDHQAKPDHVERFEREAKAIARLSHTNCVTLFDFGFSDEFRANYMVMEFIEGEELFAITRERKLPFAIAVRIGIQLSEALAHAHKHGILHRDLKPENVLVTSDWEVKVLDFGLARLLDLFAADAGGRRLTAEGAIFGTPAYMSPEQCSGDLDVTVRSDIYSLGIMLYELFEGQLPFRAKEVVKILVQQARDPAPPMEADVPAEVKRLVARMLEKDPHKRPRTGTQVADRLRAVLINLAAEGNELSADVSQEIQRSLLRNIDRADQTGEGIRITEDGLESRTEPIDDLLDDRPRTATRELTGRKLGDYTLSGIVREGSLGSVFDATNATGAQVAVEVVTADLPDRVRESAAFIAKLTALKTLRSPAIAALLDSGYEHDSDRFFLVSEFQNGDDVAAICGAGRAPTELAVRVAKDVLKGLTAAHHAGILHGDLRPSNVMLVPGTGQPRAIVLDLGYTALRADVTRLTHDNLSPAAIRYAAPEQLRGDRLSEASDLYALGVILYQMLSGHVPFDAKTHTELATQILGSTVPPLSEYVREVPVALSELVSELLNRNPAKRPATADAVLSRLATIQSQAAIREPQVEHEGKAADIATAWRLRRSVQPPAPGGQTVTQRSTTQSLSGVYEAPTAAPRTWLIVAVVIIVAFAIVLVISMP